MTSTSTDIGGGIAVTSGTATIERCTIASNSAAHLVLLVTSESRSVRSAEHLAREIGLAGRLPWVYEERAALARLRGDESERRAALAEARRLYDAIGASGHVQRIALELGPGD